MKRKILLLNILVLGLGLSLQAQAPQAIQYQTIIRNAAGEVVMDQAVGLQLTIRKGSTSGTPTYQETHTATTNGFGLVNLQIGRGTPTSGTFSAIDWSAGPYYLEVGLDLTGGSSYTVMGTTQLLSVPYALYAETAGSISATTYAVGDKALGGTVFYVNADGTHGLVAANQDQYTAVNWYNAHDELNNPGRHDTEGAKYFDWRLPTSWELNEMYNQRSNIGGFDINFYWSSPEYGNLDAWLQVFNDGSQGIGNKDLNGRVRAVRAF